MLKPIGQSGALNLGPGAMFTLDTSATPFQALEAARQLHETLFQDVDMEGSERRLLARQISGHLFAVEADHILPAIPRAFFVRLRTDAHQRAASIHSGKLAHPNRILTGYDQIEDGLRFST